MGNVMWMSFAGLGPIQQKMKGETNAGRYCQGINLAEYAYYINHVTVPVGKKCIGYCWISFGFVNLVYMNCQK